MSEEDQRRRSQALADDFGDALGEYAEACALFKKEFADSGPAFDDVHQARHDHAETVRSEALIHARDVFERLLARLAVLS